MLKIITDVQWKKVQPEFKRVAKGQKFLKVYSDGQYIGETEVMVVKQKDLEAEVERLFYQVASGVQINVMNLGKISKAGIDAYLAGENMQKAVIAAVAQYREN